MEDKNDRVLCINSFGKPVQFKSYLLGNPKDIWPDGTVSREEGVRILKLWIREGFSNLKLVSINSIIGIESIQPPVKQAESSNNMKMNISREKLITAIQASIDAKQTEFDTKMESFQQWVKVFTELTNETTLSECQKETAVDNALNAFSISKPTISRAQLNIAKEQIAKLNLSTDETIELDATDVFLGYIQ